LNRPLFHHKDLIVKDHANDFFTTRKQRDKLNALWGEGYQVLCSINPQIEKK